MRRQALVWPSAVICGSQAMASACRKVSTVLFAIAVSVYEGISTGMGLGLSFVTVILEHHSAMLAIDSQPLKGALLRLSFPLAANTS